MDCHSRVPSGVPLPASGLSAASGQHASQRAEGAMTQPQGETELSGATAHFPNLKSRYSEPQATRKEGSFEKLHFSLTRGLAQVSLDGTIKSAICRLRLDLCKVGFAQRPHCRRHGRPGIRAAPPIQRDGDRCKRNGDSQSQGFRKCGFKPKSGGNAQILDLRRPLRASLDPDHQSVIMSELL